MASFKRIRLDPDTPIPGTSRNQPGANEGGGGRGYLDNSSFSSSTSGGSSSYMRSAGPFRTRYSQPLRVPTSPSSSSFSRFSPYYFGKERRTSLRVPLIRARRDESDSEGYRPSSRASLNSSLGGDSTTSATTSTAQRIIETLQNLSTPVMNAGKIRIDQDIKAVQPLPFGSGSTLSRYSPGGSPLSRTTGPPKMCSSLLLTNPSSANQISPMSNLGDHRRLFCIPKMIDAATNTEKELDIFPSPTQKSNKVGTEINRITAVSTSSRSVFPGISTSMKSVTATKDDNSDDEFHDCSSEFTFSNAWAPEVFNRYFADAKNGKTGDRKNSTAKPQQPHLINGFKEAEPLSATSILSAKSSTSAATSSLPSNNLSANSTINKSATTTSAPFTGFGHPGSGSVPQFSFGGSSAKSSSMPVGKGKRKASESPPPSPDPKKVTSESEPPWALGSKKPLTAPALSGVPNTFKFGAQSSGDGTPEPIKSTFSFMKNKDTPTDNKPTTMASADKVDSPKTDNIISAKPSFSSASSNVSITAAQPSQLPPLAPLVAKPAGNKWKCPTCDVMNEMSAQTCVCCSEKNPNPISAAPVKKKWRCPTCCVENELDVAACVCCAEKNPNKVSAPSAPVKKWRCTTCYVENDPSAPACVCCNEKNPNPVGDCKKSDSSGAAAPFKFGLSSSATTAAAPTGSASSTFTFGQPVKTSDTSKSPLPSFKFGVPTPSATTPTIAPVTSTATATVTTATSSGSITAVTTSAQSTPFTFGSQPSTGFKFGSGASTTATTSVPSATPSFGFGSPLSTSSKPTPTTNTESSSTTSIFGGMPKSTAEPTGGTTSAPASSSIFGSSSVSTPSAFPSSNPNPSFSFGNPAPASGGAPEKAPEQPSFSFGGASAAKQPAFGSSGTFSFGNSQQQPPATSQPSGTASILSGTSPLSPISTPAASAPITGNTPNFSFGSSNPSATSSFGQLQPPSNPAPPPTNTNVNLFQFGGNTANNRVTPSPSPAPSFSFSPNLNFGATPGSTIPFGNPTQPTPNAGSQPPPSALFQFSAATPASETPGGRKIRKAVRRFNK